MCCCRAGDETWPVTAPHTTHDAPLFRLHRSPKAATASSGSHAKPTGRPCCEHLAAVSVLSQLKAQRIVMRAA
jgi:hypothetical protein